MSAASYWAAQNARRSRSRDEMPEVSATVWGIAWLVVVLCGIVAVLFL